MGAKIVQRDRQLNGLLDASFRRNAAAWALCRNARSAVYSSRAVESFAARESLGERGLSCERLGVSKW